MQEDKITRMFYGIGPSFKYQRNDRFAAEVFLRGGLANIKVATPTCLLLRLLSC
ncbi:hypothetical protein LWM68_43210 [Niabella sp. W65]|nr:hypothetical protein [Niabella sp. W65]MCH7368948.1 hypothetical protein [Niabella sp. W65]